MVKYIYGLEMDIQKSTNFNDTLYFKAGKFVGDNISYNIEPMSIRMNCDDIGNNAALNFYFNPTTYKFSALSMSLTTPHAEYGWHIGGITKRSKDNGQCIYKFLLPENDGVEYINEFDSNYNISYEGDESNEPLPPALPLFYTELIVSTDFDDIALLFTSDTNNTNNIFTFDIDYGNGYETITFDFSGGAQYIFTPTVTLIRVKSEDTNINGAVFEDYNTGGK